jgi:hypothetical protein
MWNVILQTCGEMVLARSCHSAGGIGEEQALADRDEASDGREADDLN